MIRDTTAQRIASEWHGGQTSALYALSSTGAISDRLGGELDQEYRDARTTFGDIRHGTYTAKDREDLRRLMHYCDTKGPRGPVDGWHENVIRRQK